MKKFFLTFVLILFGFILSPNSFSTEVQAQGYCGGAIFCCPDFPNCGASFGIPCQGSGPLACANNAADYCTDVVGGFVMPGYGGCTWNVPPPPPPGGGSTGGTAAPTPPASCGQRCWSCQNNGTFPAGNPYCVAGTETNLNSCASGLSCTGSYDGGDGNIYRECHGAACNPPPPPSGAVCLNGIVEAGEECDDGDGDNNNRCSNTCTINYCPILNSISCDENTDTITVDWDVVETATTTYVGGASETYILRFNHNHYDNSQCLRNSDGTPIGWVCNPSTATTCIDPSGVCDDRWRYGNGLGPDATSHQESGLVGGYQLSIQIDQSNGDCGSYAGGVLLPGRIDLPDVITTCGCQYNSIDDTPTINQAGANIDHQSIRLSPNQTHTLAWQHDGDFGVNNPISCGNGEYLVRVVEKTGNNVVGTGNCNGPEVTSYTVGNTTRSVNIPAGTVLDWNQAYCWNVTAQNGDPVNDTTSPWYTFRTNFEPTFERMGVQFGDPPAVDAINIGGAIPNYSATNLTCSTATANPGCSLTSTGSGNFGGSDCWVGVSPSSTHNSLTLWFEYDDIDHNLPASALGQPTEFYRHSLLFNTSDLSGSNLARGVLNADPNSQRIISNLLVSSISPGGYANVSSSHSGVSVQARKVVDGNNRIRIYYNIDFNDNFPTGNYYIYPIMESTVTPTSELLADNSDPLNVLQRWYTQTGQWSVDSDTPNGSVGTPNITGSNSFEIPWDAAEIAGNQSGIGTVVTNCSSLSGTDIPLTLDSYADLTTTYPIGESLLVTPTGINCFGTAQATSITNTLITDGVVETAYSIDDVNEYNSLQVELVSLQDVACNEAGGSSLSLSLNPPWLTTQQGTVYSDDSIDLNIPSSLADDSENVINIGEDPSYPPINGTIQNQVHPNMIHLSTNMLGAQSGLDDEISIINASNSAYEDFNETTERLGFETTTWYEYQKAIIDLNGKNIIDASTDSPSLAGVSMASSLPGCTGPGNECYIQIANLTMSGENTCDAPIVIFATGTIDIEGDIITDSENSGCIFISQGTITIASDSRPQKDLLAGFTTSPYDFIEGFFITEGNFVVENDQQDVGGILFADGLLVSGGVVAAGEVQTQRDLGLRNNSQPPFLLQADTRYMYLPEFVEAFDVSTIQLREK